MGSQETKSSNKYRDNKTGCFGTVISKDELLKTEDLVINIISSFYLSKMTFDEFISSSFTNGGNLLKANYWYDYVANILLNDSHPNLRVIHNALIPEYSENKKSFFNINLMAFVFTKNNSEKHKHLKYLIELDYSVVTFRSCLETVKKILNYCYITITLLIKNQISFTTNEELFQYLNVEDGKDTEEKLDLLLNKIFSKSSIERKMELLSFNLLRLVNKDYYVLNNFNGDKALSEDKLKLFYEDNKCYFNIFSARQEIINEYKNYPRLFNEEFGIL